MYYQAVRDYYNISIITHNRPDLLKKTIQSVLNAVKSRNVHINIVWQQPDDSTLESTRRVIDKYSDHFEKIEFQQKTHSIPEDNIDAARLKALEMAFLDPSIKYAVVLEDDVCLADDAFDFIESIIAKHGTKKAFRGVNFGSKEINSVAEGYSKNRYGIHGPASMITRRTFIRSGLSNSCGKTLPKTWDAFIESYLKTGYMVTPNLSRYIDLGINGTHANASNSEYFSGLRKSFKVLSETKREKLNYSLMQIPHTWRHDCVHFNGVETPLYLLKHLVSKFQERRFYNG